MNSSDLEGWVWSAVIEYGISDDDDKEEKGRRNEKQKVEK
jgi:hypothetical protein